MAADQTIALDTVSAKGYVSAVKAVELGTFGISLDIVAVNGPGGGGGSGGGPTRPSSGFLYPRGDQ